jgi:hypothetical protein
MELPTLSDLALRLDRLDPEAKALWGKMNLAQMLLHCRMPLEAGLGERELKMQGNFFTRWLLFPILIRVPWPKGKAQTHPGLNVVSLNAPVRTVAEEAAALKERLAIWREGHFGHWEHPIFGRISKPGWDLLQRRHLDHHFRQFGF